MVVLDATIVNIALPQIQQALGFSTTDLSWVLNAYTLTFGGLLLLGGRAGDILGRRRVFIAGILIFTLASFLGGLATSVGLAAGRPRPPGRRRRDRRADRPGPDHHQLRRGPGAQPGLRGVRGRRRRRRRPRPARRRHAHLVAVVALGAVRQRAHRRPAGRRWPRCTSPSPSASRAGSTSAGALTSTAGMTALVYGFISAAQDGWSDPTTVGSFTAAVVLLAAFLSIETRTRQPITPLHMFADRNRAGSYAIMLSLAAAMFGMFFFLTLFVQDVLGYSPAAGRPLLPARHRRHHHLLPVRRPVPAQARPQAPDDRRRPAGRRRPRLADPGLGDQRLRRRPPRPHAAVRPRHGPAVRPPDRGRRLRRPAPRGRRRLQPAQRHAAGRRLARPVHPGHRLRHRQPQRGHHPGRRASSAPPRPTPRPSSSRPASSPPPGPTRSSPTASRPRSSSRSCSPPWPWRSRWS